MEPLCSSSSVLKMSQDDRRFYKKHHLKDYFDGDSLKQRAKVDCKYLDKKQNSYSIVAKSVLNMMEQSFEYLSKQSKPISVTYGEVFLIDKKFKVAIKKIERWSGCPFSEKTKKKVCHCNGVSKDEKKFHTLVFKIFNIASNEQIEVEGITAHFIREHHTFGKIKAKKLIKFMEIKKDVDYKPEIKASDLSSNSELTGSESEKPEKPKPTKLESIPTKKPVLNFVITAESIQELDKPIATLESTKPTKPIQTNLQSQKPVFGQNPSQKPDNNNNKSVVPVQNVPSESSASTSGESEKDGDDCRCTIS